jgi:hypothetical protein
MITKSTDFFKGLDTKGTKRNKSERGENENRQYKNSSKIEKKGEIRSPST